MIPPPDYYAGQSIGASGLGGPVRISAETARMLNELWAGIRRMSKLTGVPPVWVRQSNAGRVVGLDLVTPLWGKLQSGGTFIEQIWDADSAEWSDAPGGYTGTAVAVPGQSASTGQVVRLVNVGGDNWAYDYPKTCADVCFVLKNSSGNPIADATCTLTPATGSAITATTNAGGVACLNGVPAAVYVATVSGVTPTPAAADVHITAGCCCQYTLTWSGGTGAPTLTSCCQCPATQLCITAVGQCEGGDLSGVVITLKDPNGTTVGTQTTDDTGKVCFDLTSDLVEGTYSFTGVWNSAQTVSGTKGLTTCAGTQNATLTFLDQVTVQVQGCNGPIAGATVVCGPVSGTTDSSGNCTLSFANAVPPSPLEATVTIPTGPSRVISLSTGGVADCSAIVTFLDQICVTVNGCQPNRPGAVVTVTGPETFSGTTDGTGKVCFVPTVDWIPSTPTVTVTKAYYQPFSQTYSLITNFELGSICDLTIGLQNLPCYQCCGTCPDPIPSTLIVTDVNGAHEMPFVVGQALEGTPGCSGSVCYRAPIPAADSAYDYEGIGTVAVTLGVVVSGDGNWSVGATWPVAVPGALQPSALYMTTWPCGYSYEEYGGNDIVADSVQVPWTGCTPPVNFAGTLPPNGTWTPDPVAGPITVTDGCTTYGGGTGTIFARGNGSNPAAAGWTGYSATVAIEDAAVTVRLLSTVAGTASVLGLISGVGGPGDWYQVQLSTSGTTISVQVQRQSDSQYLQANGSWNTTQANCLSVTDSSVTGAGYMGVGLTSSATQLLESDNFLIPIGAFSGAISEDWDEVTAPALPSSGFVFNGSLVTDGTPPLAAISFPNVLEAPLGDTGYAAYSLTDTGGGNVTVSAWFGIAASSYYYYSGGGGGGGGSGGPTSVTLGLDSNPFWGTLASTNLTLTKDGGEWLRSCVQIGDSTWMDIIVVVSVETPCSDADPNGAAVVSIEVQTWTNGGCDTLVSAGFARSLAMTMNNTTNTVNWGNGTGEYPVLTAIDGDADGPPVTLSPDPAVMTVEIGC